VSRDRPADDGNAAQPRAVIDDAYGDLRLDRRSQVPVMRIDIGSGGANGDRHDPQTSVPMALG
jgi:hypothetical protein